MSKRHGFHRNYGPKPVNEGSEYTLTVEEPSRRGDGIARVNGFIVFIPNGKKGETYRVKIVKVGSTYAVSEIISSNEQAQPQPSEPENKQ